LDSVGGLEEHLVAWMTTADQRCHGTTREAPIVRFERDERAAAAASVVAARGCADAWRSTRWSTSTRSAKLIDAVLAHEFAHERSSTLKRVLNF
jgi:hypothetical protein